ncbi:MAG: ABC transporter permease [Desulfitibacter sp. BRH_c19]|nr:MAG: ABC transporter permease [Desulfitibacter sp. BRH_c19]
MLLKILKKDFHRNKIITIALFIFIMLAALLVASASNMIMALSSSLEYLFTESKAPHFVQMHSGEIDQGEIDVFASGNRLVKEQQTVEMIGIDGTNIFLGTSQTAEENSVMDISFVKQNGSFDLLLNLDSQVIVVSEGEIAVPIYYMQQKNMKIGDKVRISKGSFNMEFIVTDFVRDVLMNPSIISSKRFVVHESNFEMLKMNLGEVEYLIEFLLTDLSRLSEFSNDYQTSNLPQKGPTIDDKLFKTLNALTDGIVAAVIIFVSLLLTVIAILCLRFTIIATMEEDYREIGIMKAIGIAGTDIKRIYLIKYIVMAFLASVSGYLASLFINHLFTANMSLYMGAAKKSILDHLVPFIGTALIFLIVLSFCQLILRRFRRITAVEALRSGSIGESLISKNLLPLSKSSFLNVNIFLGLKDVLGRFKVFGLLCFVFVICSFIIIVPVNFLNTIQSPNFMTYMGIGQSDIRIDIQQSDDVVQRFDQMIAYIENDKDVERFSPFITCKFKVQDSDGTYKNINVETGDFSIFPLEYLSGAAPVRDNEIALSYLNAQELDKAVGDELQLIAHGQELQMTVSGIYQDVTNGGKTAKTLLPYDAETVLWNIVSVDVKPGIDASEKINEYAEAFYPAKVTHLDEYLSQTFRATIEQLKLITALAILIAISVSILITSLFLKMLIAKDSSEIAIMKSLGFSLMDIRVQYITRALLVLGIGIIVGTIASNTLGQGLVSIMGSFMGASKINFVIDPVVAYVLCPLVQIVVVAITTLVSTMSMKKSNISEMIAE